ncbi:AcrR family transcriptional regulator [Lipingzhangella halophila]|uniref:AcrR family transcriptional regulator n=1 Tax=Lipingzhangella halophila TaxID=1783352 RepID=A0A7W7REZ5_9ACTN|nr:TetR/AcrR family transcriptional regulator [Lipingzhangella halophila]MBB4930782.1 AcrR family transcriptional regulator [Lipingzhangella halophila]
MDTSLHPPGRPRSQRANDAILKAALELLAEQKNLADVSVEAIAARAGVGKATIYRRWSCKGELLTAAVATLRPPLPEVGNESVRDDLVELVTQICRDMDSPLDMAIRGLLLSDTHPEIIDRIKRTVFAPREEAIHAVLRRGIASGELRPGLEPAVVQRMLVGGALAGRGSEPAGSHRAYAERLVDTVLDGARTAAGA